MVAAAQKLRLDDVRQQLARSHVGAAEEGQAGTIPMGVDALDSVLPRGGLPRGQVTELVGVRGSGGTTLMVGAVVALAQRGERSAIVDLTGELDPASIAAQGVPPGWVWVVRPETLGDGLWAADQLVRSGHFGLVVLDGVSSDVPLTALVRLRRNAQEADTAVLVRTPTGVSAPGSLKIRLRPGGVEWEEGLGAPVEPCFTRFAVCVDKGWGEASVRIPCRPWRVLGRHDDVPDRREARWTECFGAQCGSLL